MRRKRQRPHLDEPEALQAILGRAGETRFSTRARPPLEPEMWRDVVGPRISERAQPISLQDGILLLRTPNSVWAHELSLLADTICGRLKERGIDVARLRFRVGEPSIPVRAPEPRTSRSVPAVRALPREVTGALADIGDEDLRATIARAAAANLAWQSSSTPAAPQVPSEAQRAARAPRASGSGSGPPARTSPASPAGGPDRPGGERGPRR